MIDKQLIEQNFLLISLCSQIMLNTSLIEFQIAT